MLFLWQSNSEAIRRSPLLKRRRSRGLAEKLEAVEWIEGIPTDRSKLFETIVRRRCS